MLHIVAGEWRGAFASAWFWFFVDITLAFFLFIIDVVLGMVCCQTAIVAPRAITGRGKVVRSGVLNENFL